MVCFIVVLYLIDSCQLQLVLFMVALYIVVNTIYIYVDSILTSNITIFFINYIVIIDGDCRSYYEFVNCYFLAFTHLLMVYLSITLSQIIFYDINQWVQQYCNYLNDHFDSIISENGKKYHSYGYLYCVTINFILMCVMLII